MSSVGPLLFFTIIMLFDLKSSKQDFVYARTAHLVLISRKKSHYPNYERKVAVKLWKGEKKVEISLITRVRGRVFLKGHFVKYQKAHPITQQGGTQGEHIQKEGINKQV